MTNFIEKITPLLKPFFIRLTPGVMFATIASEFQILDMGMDNWFFDTIICFVYGAIIIAIGAPFIKIFSPKNIEGDEAKIASIQKIQYIFSASAGVFVALLICWIGDLIIRLDLFEDNKKSYFYLGVIILGFVISIITFLIKMARKQ